MLSVHDQIIDYVRACSQKLFSHYLDTPPDLLSNASLSSILSVPGRTGVIGFTGQSLRGTLVLFVSESLLAAMWPGKGLSPADWIGELANQALGSIKMALLPHGADFDLGLPSVTSGSNCRIFIRNDSPLFILRSVHGTAMLCFQYTLSDSLVWHTTPRPLSSNSIPRPTSSPSIPMPSLDSDVILF